MKNCTCTIVLNKGTQKPDYRMADPDCPVHPPVRMGEGPADVAAWRRDLYRRIGGRPPVNRTGIERKLATFDRLIADLQAKRARLAARLDERAAA